MYINGVYIPEEGAPSSTGIPTYGISQPNYGAMFQAAQQAKANLASTQADTSDKQAQANLYQQETTQEQLNSLMKFSGPAMYGVMTADSGDRPDLYKTFRQQIANISPSYLKYVPEKYDPNWVLNTFNESQDPSKLIGYGMLNKQAEMISGQNLPGIPDQQNFLHPPQSQPQSVTASSKPIRTPGGPVVNTPTMNYNAQPSTGGPIDMGQPYPGTNIPRQAMLDALLASQTGGKGASYAMDRAILEPSFVNAQNAGKLVTVVDAQGNYTQLPLDVWQKMQNFNRNGAVNTATGPTPGANGGAPTVPVLAPKTIQTSGGPQTIQAPVAHVYSQPQGVTPQAFQYLPKSPQEAMQMGGITAPVGASKLNPAQVKMQEDAVGEATKYEEDLSKKAMSAQAMGVNIDAAFQSLQGFTPNNFAYYQQQLQQTLNGLSGGEYTGNLKDMQAFNKNITDMVRTTIPGLGGRAAWSEVSYLKDAFPSMNLTDQGAHFLLGEFAAVRHDYPVAEQQFMSKWKQMYGTNVGAEAAWNKNVTAPIVYMTKYASDDDNKKLAAYLAKSPQGKDMTARMLQTRNFLQSMGLWNNL